MRVEQLSHEVLHVLVELTARLKHDLGRYIWFNSAALAEDATEQLHYQALVEDILSTRMGPTGSETAVQIWNSFAPILLGEQLLESKQVSLVDDPDILLLMEAMEVIRAFIDESSIPVAQVRQASYRIAQATRSLHRRVNERISWPIF